VVKNVEQTIVNSNLDKEYAPIEGDALFLEGARKVLFGFDNQNYKDERIVSAQTLSGTGALKVLCDFLY
jgi:aspartate/tyrosine/aromatic aminotransferase